MATATPHWVERTGPDQDIALVSRARLARNLDGYPFPHRASENVLAEIALQARRACRQDLELGPLLIDTLPEPRRTELIAAQRISPQLADAGPHRWALLDRVGALSILVNEEDHLRIQALAPGMAVDDALERVEAAERILALRLPFALDLARWGYLTASLSNVGTGLRVSVLLHLPALAWSGTLGGRLEAARTVDTAVRGLRGEGSETVGSLYQVSNAVSFGRATADLAARVRGVGLHLIAAERDARATLHATAAAAIKDAARRTARRLADADGFEEAEALEALSILRLAAALGLVSAPDDRQFAGLVSALRGGDGPNAAIGRAALLRDRLTREPQTP
jgi:protein arginine kinase